MNGLAAAGVFWTLLCGGAIAVGYGIALPFLTLAGDRMQVDADLAAAQSRLHALAVELGSLRNKPSADVSRYTSKTTNAAAEATSLQEQVRQIITSAQGVVLGSQSTLQALSPQQAKITVLIQARFDEQQVFAALGLLETGPKPFAVDTMTLDLLPVAPDGRNLNAVMTLSRLVDDAS